jgi:hypothetical protein
MGRGLGSGRGGDLILKFATPGAAFVPDVILLDLGLTRNVSEDSASDRRAYAAG